MKYSLWIALVTITALTACNDNVSELYTPSTHAISYSVETAEQTASRSSEAFAMTSEESADTLYAILTEYQPEITRGTPVTSKDELTEDIAVSGYYRAGSDSKAVNVFNDEKLDHDSDYSSLKSGETYYWPVSGNMDFYAIYPAGNENVEFDYDTKLITYKMPEEASDQKDILLATKEDMTESSNNGTVELSFDHICSRLSFRLDDSFELEGSEGNNTVIEEITIDGIYRDGVYDISEKTWDVSGDNLIKVENLAQPTIIGGNSYTDNLLTDEKSLIVIPQVINDITITVRIGEYKEENGNYKISNSAKWECNLTAQNFKMEAGGSYYITLSKDTELSDTKYSDKGEIEYTDYDSYYYFKEYSFNLSEGTKSWAIVADVDWITFSKTESKYQKYGFWVDKESGSAIVRGTNDGTKKEVTVWAYCKENLSTSDRQAKIMLIENGELTDCLFMNQKQPLTSVSYYTANYEYKSLDGKKTVSCWGFYTGWPTITFTSSTVDFEDLIKKEDQQEAIDIQDSSSDIYKYISLSKSNGLQTLTLNFNKAWDFVLKKPFGSNDYEGFENTVQDFFHNNNGDNKGLWHMLQMALAFKDRAGITMNGSLDKVIDCAIVRAVQYNQFKLINKYGAQVPDITESELQWYLPAQNETKKNNLELDTQYWSSTASIRKYSQTNTAYSFSYTEVKIPLIGTLEVSLSTQWNDIEKYEYSYRILGAVKF
jgi:hypothetical protein